MACRNECVINVWNINLRKCLDEYSPWLTGSDPVCYALAECFITCKVICLSVSRKKKTISSSEFNNFEKLIVFFIQEYILPAYHELLT